MAQRLEVVRAPATGRAFPATAMLPDHYSEFENESDPQKGAKQLPLFIGDRKRNGDPCVLGGLSARHGNSPR